MRTRFPDGKQRTACGPPPRSEADFPSRRVPFGAPTEIATMRAHEQNTFPLSQGEQDARR